MPALSLDDINAQNPEKVYDLPLTLNILYWNKIDLPIDLPEPIKLRFDESIRSNFPPNLKDRKGIYMFVVEPSFPFNPKIDYLLYVGRVIRSNTFFKRFYRYEKSIGQFYSQRNIQLLTNLWPGKTFVYFFDISSSDEVIVDIEKQIIKYIIPSLNNQIFVEGAHNPRSILN